jgi:hypothetical protein
MADDPRLEVKAFGRARLAREAEGWRIDAAMTEIMGPADLLPAAELLKGIAALKARIKDWCEPNIKRWYDGHKAALAEQKELLEPIEDAEQILKDKVAEYRVRERAERQAAMAEATRQAAEIARAEREAQVETLREAGLEGEAEILASSHLAVPPVHLAEPVKTEGVYTQRRWSAEVIDKMELIRFVAANPHFSHLLEVNTKEANALARAQNESMNIPGLRAIAKEGTVVRK